MQLFIVGMWRDEQSPWEFCGVFDSREAAEAVCIDWRFFVGPAVLNRPTPVERVDWPGTYFPKSVPSTGGVLCRPDDVETVARIMQAYEVKT